MKQTLGFIQDIGPRDFLSFDRIEWESLYGEALKAKTPLKVAFTLYSPKRSSVTLKLTILWATRAASDEVPAIRRRLQGFSDCPSVEFWESINGQPPYDELLLSRGTPPNAIIWETKSQFRVSLLIEDFLSPTWDPLISIELPTENTKPISFLVSSTLLTELLFLSSICLAC